MHRYLLLNTGFLLIIIALTGALWLRRKPAVSLRNIGYCLGLLLVLTMIFDSLIVGLHIVAYDPAKILGLNIIKAPLEDFFYTIGSVITTAVLWELIETRKDQNHKNQKQAKSINSAIENKVAK